MQSFGSQEWDTGFAIQALISSNLTDEIGDVLKRGHDFIKKSQVYINIIKYFPFFFSFRSYSLFCGIKQLQRSRAILPVTSRVCTDIYLRDHGLSPTKIMDGKFPIALQKD